MSATALRRPCCKFSVCYDLTWVWREKARVCQLFEVFQHYFANFSLPCEGRLTHFNNKTDRSNWYWLNLFCTLSLLRTTRHPLSKQHQHTTRIFQTFSHLAEKFSAWKFRFRRKHIVPLASPNLTAKISPRLPKFELGKKIDCVHFS